MILVGRQIAAHDRWEPIFSLHVVWAPRIGGDEKAEFHCEADARGVGLAVSVASVFVVGRSVAPACFLSFRAASHGGKATQWPFFPAFACLCNKPAKMTGRAGLAITVATPLLSGDAQGTAHRHTPHFLADIRLQTHG